MPSVSFYNVASYIGFCSGSPPTSLSWSQSGFCFWQGRLCMPCVAEAGGAFRTNGALENIFEFLLVKPPREFLLTGSSSSARPKRIGAGEGGGDRDLGGREWITQS